MPQSLQNGKVVGYLEKAAMATCLVPIHKAHCPEYSLLSLDIPGDGPGTIGRTRAVADPVYFRFIKTGQ